MSLFLTKRGLTARVLAVSAITVIPACGSSTVSAPPTTVVPAATFPVTIASVQGPVTLASQPKAIVSLSPTATESLFAISAGAQVVAVDDQSDFPANAPRSGLSGLNPNVEAIAAKHPDLVVIADDAKGVAASLAKVNIPVVVQSTPKTIDDVYDQIKQLGLATGHPGQAITLVASMSAQIAKLVQSVPKHTPPKKIYDELDQTLFSVTSSAFPGQVFKQMGAANIADAADKTGSGYPQLSNEYVVSANPDFIFLSDTKCCQQNKATIAARPGWSGVSAVKTGQVIELDDSIASRWGPRFVDLVAQIAHALGAAS